MSSRRKPEALEKVVICGRGHNDSGVKCRNGCGFSIELDGTTLALIAGGASPLCIECATELSEKHPDAFTRKERSDN